MKCSLDVPECMFEVSPVPLCWSCKMSSVILRCKLEVWTYQGCPDEHSNDFAVDVMSIWIQLCILVYWRSPQRWCRCWNDVVVEVHVLQHAAVVGPFQTDCDVSTWMSADALSQEAKWLLCGKNCRVFQAERLSKLLQKL